MKIILSLVLLTSLQVKAQSYKFPDTAIARFMFVELTNEKEYKDASFNFGKIAYNFSSSKKNIALNSLSYYMVSSVTAFNSYQFKQGSIKNKEKVANNNLQVFTQVEKDSIFTNYIIYQSLDAGITWQCMALYKFRDSVLPKEISFSKINGDKFGASMKSLLVNYSPQGFVKIDSVLFPGKAPSLREMRNKDSAAVSVREHAYIKKQNPNAIFKEGIYYEMLKEGSGKQVTINDEVTITYKGTNYATGKTFDETKNEPISFPLKYLIKGWQIALPLCKVGSKIRIILPSDKAYGLRYVTENIPPNSILQFDIEVFDTKLFEDGRKN